MVTQFPYVYFNYTLLISLFSFSFTFPHPPSEVHRGIVPDSRSTVDAAADILPAALMYKAKMLQLPSRVENNKSANSLLTCEWGRLVLKTSTFCTHTLDTHNNWQHLASVLGKPLADNVLSGLINALARWMNSEMCQFYDIFWLLVFFSPQWCFSFIKA